MIRSANEFVELRDADDARAGHEEAPESVWLDVIRLHPSYKVWVVRNKTVPVTILLNLARDPDPSVRHAVAMKRRCPREVFELLARDDNEAVRSRVAWNSTTPADVLAMLRMDPKESVAKAASERLGDE